MGYRDNRLARLGRDFERVIAMTPKKTAPNPDDIELHPDAWERSVDAVKRVAQGAIALAVD